MIINPNQIDWDSEPEKQVAHYLEVAVKLGILADYGYAHPIYSEWFVVDGDKSYRVENDDN